MKIPISGAVRERWLTREEFDAVLASAKHQHVQIYMMIAIVTAGQAGCYS